MASIDWPWALARIRLEGYRTEFGPNVRRTQFDSGAVRQVSVDGRDVLIREVRIDVADGDVAAFQAWLSTNGAEPFNFTDWTDGAERDTQIQGGRVSLSRGAGRIEGGARYLTGRAVIESFV